MRRTKHDLFCASVDAYYKEHVKDYPALTALQPTWAELMVVPALLGYPSNRFPPPRTFLMFAETHARVRIDRMIAVLERTLGRLKTTPPKSKRPSKRKRGGT